MQRIQVMLEDNMADALKQKAHDSGLSISSYVRLVINSSVKQNKPSVMDEAILSLGNQAGDEVSSLDAFQKSLDSMINNAKG
jgi:hypothetical protein